MKVYIYILYYILACLLINIACVRKIAVLSGRMGDNQNWSGFFGEEKMPFPCQELNQHSLVHLIA
jgi:hypothetical protein